MLRGIAAMTVGLFVGVLVVALVEAAGHALFPPPQGNDVRDTAALRELIKDVPLPAKIAVLVAWAAGVLSGGVAGVFVGRARWPAYAIGACLLAAGAWTMLMIPHPWWMWIGAIIATVGGAIAAARFTPKAQG